MKINWKKYLLTAIWLTFPILLWNGVFGSYLPAQYLPEIFWKDIPLPLVYAENGLRLVIFAMPVFFAMGWDTKIQKQGWGWYIAGSLVYFSSWLPLFFAAGSAWSTSIIGFMAPAYTPLLWLIGIALLGGEFYFPLRYRPIYYIAPAVLFTIFHCAHVALVYLRNF